MFRGGCGALYYPINIPASHSGVVELAHVFHGRSIRRHDRGAEGWRSRSCSTYTTIIASTKYDIVQLFTTHVTTNTHGFHVGCTHCAHMM
jgi:hypothetical protein